MAERFIGQGITVEHSPDGGTTKTPVVQIQSITLPGSAVEKVDATVIADTVKQFVSSRQKEYEDFGAEYLYDPNDTDQAALETLEGSGEIVSWYVTFPAVQPGGNATEILFSGWVMGVTGNDIDAASTLRRNLAVVVTSEFAISSPPAP